MVWMRAAALRRFRKLWGRIDQDIPTGAEITVQIQNRCAHLRRTEQVYCFSGCLPVDQASYVQPACWQKRCM